MGNGVSANQGNLQSHGSRDVKTSVCQGQHDWLEQAEAPETHSLSTTKAKSYTLNNIAIYTVGHKKGATFVFTITLANVDRFQ